MLGKVIAVVAIVMGLAGLSSAVLGGPFGVGTVTRALLGVCGIAGGVLYFLKRPVWLPLLVTWTVLQIPVVIVDPSGPLTNQGCHLGFVQTWQSTVNGAVTSLRGFGVNAVGIILAILVVVVRASGRGAAAAGDSGGPGDAHSG